MAPIRVPAPIRLPWAGHTVSSVSVAVLRSLPSASLLSSRTPRKPLLASIPQPALPTSQLDPPSKIGSCPLGAPQVDQLALPQWRPAVSITWRFAEKVFE